MEEKQLWLFKLNLAYNKALSDSSDKQIWICAPVSTVRSKVWSEIAAVGS